MSSTNAWVTLATNDTYALGALVLAHSLKNVNTAHKIVVLVTPSVTQPMRGTLEAEFDEVNEVNVLDSGDAENLRLLARPELGVTFTKLHCWKLTQYEKCVFLDADTLILKNCDELFEREELSAAPDVGWPDCFNSGVFVFKPSLETYNSIMEFAVAHGSFDGGDQGLLNMYFSDWSTADSTKRLPFLYNLSSAAIYSYLPAFKWYGKDVKIVHFIGNSKPWLQPFNSVTRSVQAGPDSSHLRNFLQYWWDIFCARVYPQLSPEMTRLHLRSWFTLPNPIKNNPYRNNYPSRNYPNIINDPPISQPAYPEPEEYAFVDPWEEFEKAVAENLNAGLARSLSEMKLDEPTPEQLARQDFFRRQDWEHGNIDYMGRDAFDNILEKMTQTLTEEDGGSAVVESPPKEAEPAENVASPAEADPSLPVAAESQQAPDTAPASISETAPVAVEPSAVVSQKLASYAKPPSDEVASAKSSTPSTIAEPPAPAPPLPSYSEPPSELPVASLASNEPPPTSSPKPPSSVQTCPAPAQTPPVAGIEDSAPVRLDPSSAPQTVSPGTPAATAESIFSGAKPSPTTTNVVPVPQATPPSTPTEIVGTALPPQPMESPISSETAPILFPKPGSPTSATAPTITEAKKQVPPVAETAAAVAPAPEIKEIPASCPKQSSIESKEEVTGSGTTKKEESTSAAKSQDGKQSASDQKSKQGGKSGGKKK